MPNTIETDSEKKKRVVKNTLMLYARMFFLMCIHFYTTRIILNALGVTDYGISNAVGGFVGMFSVLTGSLSAAISRFITFELGRGDTERLKRIFSTSIIIQFGMATILAILLETIGYWFLNTHMTIPPERLRAANYILQFSVAGTFIWMTFTPYSAAIISHEKMNIYAYFSIIEGLITLLLAFLLQQDFWNDKLIFYSTFIFVSALFTNSLYRIYCTHHFEECKFKMVFDKSLLKDITGFAGWNFIGASSQVLKTQGVNVLFNIFCGPIVNAAQAIGQQISNVATKFSGSFMTAMNPQITKSYASEEKDYMYSLVFQGTRLSFYLFFILALPIFFETDTLLILWLRQYPEYTVAFARIILLYIVIDRILASPLITIMLATGKIRNYQIIVGGIQMLAFPLAYIILKLGFSPVIVQIAIVLVAISCMIARVIMLNRMIGFPIKTYLEEVVVNISYVTFLSCIVPALVYSVIIKSVLNDLIVCSVCVISAGVCIWLVGLKKNEKELITKKLKAYF